MKTTEVDHIIVERYTIQIVWVQVDEMDDMAKYYMANLMRG